MQTVLWIWCIEWITTIQMNGWQKKLCVDQIDVYKSMAWANEKTFEYWNVIIQVIKQETIQSFRMNAVELKAKAKICTAQGQHRDAEIANQKTQFAYEIWFLAYKQLCLLKIGKMQIAFLLLLLAMNWKID